MTYSIVSYFRVDEILAGSALALIYAGKLGGWASACLQRSSVLVIAPLLVISCIPDSGFMNYLRPYLAALLIGATLFDPRSRLAKALAHSWLSYVASISYALYVLHPLLSATWLGSGETLVKYLKRPFLILVIFLVSHLSTFHFERRCIAFGRTLSTRLAGRIGMRIAAQRVPES